VDFDTIKKSGVKAAFDALYGAGLGYVDRALSDHGIEYDILHDWHDPSFGGSAPDPSEKNLAELSKLVRSDKKIAIGLSTDGDADRFGVVDGDGTFIEPNYVIALLLDYLIGTRGFAGGVAKSVATTHLIDAVAKFHGVPCYETPVGFKYIGSYIAQDTIAGGGEESAGFTIRGHVPEKDGVITCLLALEMVARTGRSIRELLKDLYGRVGEYHTRRINLTITRELEEAFPEKIEHPPKAFAGIPIAERITIDGNKFVLDDGSWILMRKSGTEPVVRIYAEAPDESKLEKLVDAAREFVES
jgi:phosphomannomutase